jgi:hypothetical protein
MYAPFPMDGVLTFSHGWCPHQPYFFLPWLVSSHSPMAGVLTSHIFC